jgi:MFS family permease
MYLLSTVAPNTPYQTLVIYLVLCGVGMGLFTSPNISSVMGSVPPSRRGVASGLRATVFNVGLTLSFNLVILVLAFSLPYRLITSVISSTDVSAIAESSRSAFAAGLNRAYLALSVVNSLALVPSLLRGKRSAGDAARTARFK